MYAVMGITGRVGARTAQALLERGQQVRAVVRNPEKARTWAQAGATLAVAEILDVPTLTRALQGVDGAFVMVPGNFAPSPGFPEIRAEARALRAALDRAAPAKVVCLSSIGAQRAEGLGLITALHILERALAELASPIAFLRAGWFMENAAWDVEPAARTGVIDSFLQPLDRTIPMVATADLGRVAAETLIEAWTGKRVLEVEGPRRTSPNDVAAALGKALGRPVSARAVPRVTWASVFEGQGTKWPQPRIEMLAGFNSGWIDFEGAGAEHRKGATSMEDVARNLVARGR